MLYGFPTNEIHGLIKTDVAGKLYTGKKKQSNSGLVLMEIRLDWSLTGKIDVNETSDTTDSVMSLHIISVII